MADIPWGEMLKLGGSMVPGIGSVLGGDLLNLGGSILGDKLGTWMNGGKMDEMNKTFNNTMDSVQNRIPGLLNQLNTNAMGQTGDAARLGVKTAMDSFQPRSEDTSAYNAQLNDASRLRTNALNQGNLAQDTANRNMARMVNDNSNTLRLSGASPGAMAGVMRNMGSAIGDNAMNLLDKSASQYSNDISKAGQMTGQASQVYNQAKDSQWNRTVKPYMNEFQNVGSVLAPALSAATQRTQQTGDSLAATNALGGTAKLFGAMGADAASNGLTKGLMSWMGKNDTDTFGATQPEGIPEILPSTQLTSFTPQMPGPSQYTGPIPKQQFNGASLLPTLPTSNTRIKREWPQFQKIPSIQSQTPQINLSNPNNPYYNNNPNLWQQIKSYYGGNLPW